MNSIQNPVRRAFDRAAESYDGAAQLQREVASRLALRLDRLLAALDTTPPSLILDVGSGTGYGETLLRSRLPAAGLVELDIAPAMLKVARERRDGAGLACAGLCADLGRLPLRNASVAMVWSSLALQWATDLGQALTGLHRCLMPGGTLLFSTLGPGTLAELSAAFAPVDGYRHVNRFTPAEDVRAALARAGFCDIRMEQERLVMEYEDVAAVLRSLKAIGARKVLEQGVPGLMGKARWAQAQANYQSQSQNGKLPASYQVIYVTARKGG
jgi:malonyl-CoA O-methyltransferase